MRTFKTVTANKWGQAHRCLAEILGLAEVEEVQSIYSAYVAKLITCWWCSDIRESVPSLDSEPKVWFAQFVVSYCRTDLSEAIRYPFHQGEDRLTWR